MAAMINIEALLGNANAKTVSNGPYEKASSSVGGLMMMRPSEIQSSRGLHMSLLLPVVHSLLTQLALHTVDYEAA